jgi:hypothetical protein
MKSPVLAFLLALSLICFASTGRGQEDPLKILISVEQPSIVMPFPARATLHFHNSGKQPLWLYRPTRSSAKEGASLEIRLESLEAKDPASITTPAEGGVFERAGFPHPKLVRLAPGEDLTEKTTIKLLPAKTGGGVGVPVWGRYRLTVDYAARYSNANYLASETNSIFWQGETGAQPIEIELQPPAGEGTVTGTIQGAQSQTLPGVLVTLAGEDERPIDQMVTEGDGRYAFDRLPPGTYWVTVRRPNINEDTTVFRHMVLTPGAPNGTIDMMLIPPDTYEAKALLHKPLLLLVTDGRENPLSDVTYEIVWTTGKVIERIKGATESDGRVALELLPGRNFVTLKRRGCKSADHRVDVETGTGVDGVKLAIDCGAK